MSYGFGIGTSSPWTEFRKLASRYCFMYLEITSSTSGTCCNCFTSSFESEETPMKCYQNVCQAHFRNRASFTTTLISRMRTKLTLPGILRTRKADMHSFANGSAGSASDGDFRSNSLQILLPRTYLRIRTFAHDGFWAQGTCRRDFS